MEKERKRERENSRIHLYHVNTNNVLSWKARACWCAVSWFNRMFRSPSNFRLCMAFYGFPWINQQSLRNCSFATLCDSVLWFFSFLFYFHIELRTDQTFNNNAKPLFCHFLECCKNNKRSKSYFIKIHIKSCDTAVAFILFRCSYVLMFVLLCALHSKPQCRQWHVQA